jgi:hypothetical protein
MKTLAALMREIWTEVNEGNEGARGHSSISRAESIILPAIMLLKCQRVLREMQNDGWQNNEEPSRDVRSFSRFPNSWSP